MDGWLTEWLAEWMEEWEKEKIVWVNKILFLLNYKNQVNYHYGMVDKSEHNINCIK